MNSTEVKKIEEYLPLYYGCKVARFMQNGTRMKDVINHAWLLQAYESFKSNSDSAMFYDYKLLLRPLSSMSEEEEIKICEICNLFVGTSIVKAMQDKYKYLIDVNHSYELTRYLLSKGFDIFNLHESGLCIYESDLKS